MIEVRQTDAYKAWFASIQDVTTRARIDSRVRRLSIGNMGDTRPVGGGVSELRIHFGPGYRVYFVQRGKTMVILLSGGNKGSQARDIAKAKELARTV